MIDVKDAIAQCYRWAGDGVNAVTKAGRGSDQFVLRLPPGMRSRIAETAEANGRSMNGEIIARLEKSLADDGLTPTKQQNLEDALYAMEQISKEIMLLRAIIEKKKED